MAAIAAPVTWKQVERVIRPDAFTLGPPFGAKRPAGRTYIQ